MGLYPTNKIGYKQGRRDRGRFSTGQPAKKELGDNISSAFRSSGTLTGDRGQYVPIVSSLRHPETRHVTSQVRYSSQEA